MATTHNYTNVKYAAISASGSGDNTIVAAVSGKRIRVMSYTLVSAGAVGARFEDGAGGTALTGVMTLAASTVVNVPYDPAGHFQGGEGTLLNLELSGAVLVGGHFTYAEI